MCENGGKRVVVLGGSGHAGRAAISALVAGGHDVISAGRSSWNGPVSSLVVNIYDTSKLRECVASAQAVICCAIPAYTKWSTELPHFTDALIKGVEKSDALLVFCDNLYAYGSSSSPLDERSPHLGDGQKARARLKNEQTLQQAHEKGRIRLTIGKSADFVGPGIDYPHVRKMYKAILSQTRPVILGNGQHGHSVSYISDVGRGLATLATQPGAEGHIWHLPVAPPLTEIEYVRLIQRTAFPNREPDSPILLTDRMVSILGLFNPMVKELREVLYQHTQPFLVNSARFENQFGWVATSNETAVKATLDWWQSKLNARKSAR